MGDQNNGNGNVNGNGINIKKSILQSSINHSTKDASSDIIANITRFLELELSIDNIRLEYTQKNKNNSIEKNEKELLLLSSSPCNGTNSNSNININYDINDKDKDKDKDENKDKNEGKIGEGVGVEIGIRGKKEGNNSLFTRPEILKTTRNGSLNNVLNITNIKKTINIFTDESKLNNFNNIDIIVNKKNMSNESKNGKKLNEDLGSPDSTLTTAAVSVEKNNVNNFNKMNLFDNKSLYGSNSNLNSNSLSCISSVEYWQVPLIAVRTAYLNEPVQVQKLENPRRISSVSNIMRKNSNLLDEGAIKLSNDRISRIKIPSSICSIQ